jgi:hypothetical protein
MVQEMQGSDYLVMVLTQTCVKRELPSVKVEKLSVRITQEIAWKYVPEAWMKTATA